MYLKIPSTTGMCMCTCRCTKFADNQNHSKPFFLLQSSKSLPESKLSELECDQSELYSTLFTAKWNSSPYSFFLKTDYTETYSTVIKSVAAAFKQVARYLEHWDGEIMMDSLYHHCWSAPPLGYNETNSVPPSCNCGAVVKSQLPSYVTWDSFDLKEEHFKDPPSTPLSVCDPFLAKVKAIEVTGDLASTVLQTAFVISDT